MTNTLVSCTVYLFIKPAAAAEVYSGISAAAQWLGDPGVRSTIFGRLALGRQFSEGWH